MSGKIGVVTVTYNSAKYIQEFSKSWMQQSGDNYQIYFVDNNSTDNTIAEIDKFGKKTWVVIKNSRNVGVAAGNNQGIKRAIGSGCEWVFLINNDTSFGSDLLKCLLQTAATEKLHVLVPKILFDRPQNRIWYGGGGFSRLKGWTGYHQGLDEEDNGQYNKNKIVQYAPTCAMLIHKSVLEYVGLMDESFFVYFDDTDFCLRLYRAGIKIGYTGATSVVHRVGGSSGGINSVFTVSMTSRNRLYYLRKNFGIVASLFWLPIFLVYYIFSFGVRGKWSLINLSLKGLRSSFSLKYGAENDFMIK
jgi:GT2 family glycosyltransferase